MQSFVKTKPWRNGEITMSFTDIGKSCLTCEFLSSQLCLLMLFAKIKVSRKTSEFTVYKGSVFVPCEQQRRISACASAQSDSAFVICLWKVLYLN